MKDLYGENTKIPKKNEREEKTEDRNKYHPHCLAEIILSGYIAKGSMHVEYNPHKDLNKFIRK